MWTSGQKLADGFGGDGEAMQPSNGLNVCLALCCTQPVFRHLVVRSTKGNLKEEKNPGWEACIAARPAAQVRDVIGG